MTLAPDLLELPVAIVMPEAWEEQHVLVACPKCATRPPDDEVPVGDCPGLLYAWTGSDPLVAGDAVLCPPTPLHPVEWVTVVISTWTRDVPWPGYIKPILRRLP